MVRRSLFLAAVDYTARVYPKVYPLGQCPLGLFKSFYLLKFRRTSYTCTINKTGRGMKIVTFTEARNKLKTVLDRVVNDADYTVITRRDADDTVVMSLEYFNSLLETVHLLKSPANAAHLERSITQYRQGKVIEKDLLNE